VGWGHGGGASRFKLLPGELVRGYSIFGFPWGHKSAPQLFVGIGTIETRRNGLILVLRPLKTLRWRGAHFKTPSVRHAGLAAEAAAVRRPKHPIDYTRGRPLGI